MSRYRFIAYGLHTLSARDLTDTLMLTIRNLALSLLIITGCSAAPDPLDGPFGVPWGADTAQAHEIMTENGYRRHRKWEPPSDRAIDALHRMLFFSGGSYLGVESLPERNSGASSASYTLSFRDGALNMGLASLTFPDWTRCETALDRISEFNDDAWGSRWRLELPDLNASYAKPPDPRRVWPARGDVRASIRYDSTSGPPYLLMVEYVRAESSESDDLDTIAVDLMSPDSLESESLPVPQAADTSR